MTERELPQVSRTPEKKVYQKPQLTEQGNIRELTQGAGSFGTDPQGRKQG